MKKIGIFCLIMLLGFGSVFGTPDPDKVHYETVWLHGWGGGYQTPEGYKNDESTVRLDEQAQLTYDYYVGEEQIGDHIVVSHSLGGLRAMGYANKLNQNNMGEKLKGLITITSPVKGMYSLLQGVSNFENEILGFANLITASYDLNCIFGEATKNWELLEYAQPEWWQQLPGASWSWDDVNYNWEQWALDINTASWETNGIAAANQWAQLIVDAVKLGTGLDAEAAMKEAVNAGTASGDNLVEQLSTFFVNTATTEFQTLINNHKMPVLEDLVPGSQYIRDNVAPATSYTTETKRIALPDNLKSISVYEAKKIICSGEEISDPSASYEKISDWIETELINNSGPLGPVSDWTITSDGYLQFNVYHMNNNVSKMNGNTKVGFLGGKSPSLFVFFDKYAVQIGSSEVSLSELINLLFSEVSERFRGNYLTMLANYHLAKTIMADYANGNTGYSISATAYNKLAGLVSWLDTELPSIPGKSKLEVFGEISDFYYRPLKYFSRFISGYSESDLLVPYKSQFWDSSVASGQPIDGINGYVMLNDIYHGPEGNLLSQLSIGNNDNDPNSIIKSVAVTPKDALHHPSIWGTGSIGLSGTSDVPVMDVKSGGILHNWYIANGWPLPNEAQTNDIALSGTISDARHVNTSGTVIFRSDPTVVTNSAFLDIFGGLSITSVGSVEIQSDSYVRFESDNQIVLNPGFTVGSGAVFTADIRTQ